MNTNLVDKIISEQETVRSLKEQNAKLSVIVEDALELIESLDNLLGCYRFGGHPSDRLLDTIHKLRKRISRNRENQK